MMQQQYPMQQVQHTYNPTPAPAQPQPQQTASPAGMQSVILARLDQIVKTNELEAFYTKPALDALAQKISQNVDFYQLAARWRMPVELAVSLSALALYDIVIYADDSGSMTTGDGERIEDLKLIVAKVAEVATLFDEDGIAVRFINSDAQGNNIKSADSVNTLISSVSYTWDTKLATQMEARILQPMVYKHKLAKPLLVITVTDGEPSDSPKDKIVDVIRQCTKKVASQGLGPNAVAFQFAQVGRDTSAQEFLAELDNHPKVGDIIDCTSYFELEQAEYAKRGVNLSVEGWLVKLMTGAIDRAMDSQDESGGGAAAGKSKKKKGLLNKLFG